MFVSETASLSHASNKVSMAKWPHRPKQTCFQEHLNFMIAFAMTNRFSNSPPLPFRFFYLTCVQYTQYVQYIEYIEYMFCFPVRNCKLCFLGGRHVVPCDPWHALDTLRPLKPCCPLNTSNTWKITHEGIGKSGRRVMQQSLLFLTHRYMG